MIDPRQLPQLRAHIELVGQQVLLLEQKIQKAPELEERGDTQQAERQRLMDLFSALREQIPRVLQKVEAALKAPLPPPQRLAELVEIDRIFFNLKRGVEQIAKDHDECNLELHKQEIVKAVELCREAFDWILPQIRNEIVFLEKFYGESLNAPNSILPEMNSLQEKLQNHQISLEEFLYGFSENGTPVAGYRDLRTHSGVYSPFHFYDHSFETYREINTCYYEICKSMESLLKERKWESEFGEFLDRIRGQRLSIGNMADIFDATQFVDRFYRTAARKFAYKDEMKRVRPLRKQFHKLREKLVVYDLETLQRTEEELNAFYQDHPDRTRYRIIMRRVNQRVAEQTLAFNRLESIFEKLRQSDFNIVVEEPTVESLSIFITPHHEKVFGGELLNRVNTILQEIDFWYPPDAKHNLFQELTEPAQRLQEDALEDRSSFFKRMQALDQEMEQKLRTTYNDRLKEVQLILSSFQKTFADKPTRDRFADRLANHNIWEEILPRVDAIKAALRAAESVQTSKGNAHRFPHLKQALSGLCQLLYDLAMQLFVLFPGAEEKHVSSMASILFTCNEFHDLPTLWAAFSHYHKKIAIPNFPVNESMIKETSRHPGCKARFQQHSGQAI